MLGGEGSGHVLVSNTIHYAGTSSSWSCFALDLPLASYAAIDNDLCYAPGASQWVRGRGDLAAWQSYSGTCGSCSTADPLYSGVSGAAYTLSPASALSPLVNTGHGTLSAPLAIGEVARDALPDIGAYELANANEPPANQPPIAVASATPTPGAAPLQVAFDGRQSSDPNPGDTPELPLDLRRRQRRRDRRDADAHLCRERAVHGDARGAPTSSARAPAGDGADSGGQHAARADHHAPAAGTEFFVGQPITLRGTGQDAQDGALPGSALSWSVLQHSQYTHTHPYLAPTTGSSVVITAPPPAGTGGDRDQLPRGAAHGDRQRRVEHDDHPAHRAAQSRRRRSAASPTGVTLTVNGTAIVTPATVMSWEGYALNVDAPAQPRASSFRRGRTAAQRRTRSSRQRVP